MSTCLAGSLGTGKEGGKKKGSERETPNCEACLDGWNLATQHRTKYVFFVYLRHTVSNHNVLGLGRSFPQEVRRRPSTHNFCYFSFNWLVSTVIFFLCHNFRSFILCFSFSHISFSVTFYSPFFSRGHSCFSAHRSVYEVQIQSYKQLLFFLKRSIDSFKFEDSSKHFWCSKLTFFCREEIMVLHEVSYLDKITWKRVDCHQGALLHRTFLAKFLIVAGENERQWLKLAC